MPETNSGRKKTYMIIVVILLVILAVTFVTG
jgi:nitrate reductase NapE component